MVNWEPIFGFLYHVLCHRKHDLVFSFNLVLKKNKDKSPKVTEISSGVGLQIHLELPLNSLGTKREFHTKTPFVALMLTLLGKIFHQGN